MRRAGDGSGPAGAGTRPGGPGENAGRRVACDMARAASVPPLSDEQRHAVTRAAAGEDLAITARAGSGKTHTLLAVTERTAPTRTLFLAFNRAIARDAAARVPPHVHAVTVHALAFRHVVVGHPGFERKFRVAGGRVPLSALAELADLSEHDPNRWDHAQQIRAILTNFAANLAAHPRKEHLGQALREHLASSLGRERAEERARWLVRRAARAWQRIADPDDAAPLDHDAYLKLFSLARPALDADLLLVDEAQDLAPVMLTLLTNGSCRRILVGDPAQRIYAWRGAVDAMAASGLPEVRLTRSFRFGDDIAAVARRVLGVLDRRPRLSGGGPPGTVRSRPSTTAAPRTILCRTNAGVIEAALTFADAGVHVVGGVTDTVGLLRSAHALWARRARVHAARGPVRGAGPRASRAVPGDEPSTPSHPDLAGLNDWEALVRAASRHGGALRMLRTLVEAHGHDTPEVCRTLERAHRPREADAAVVLSTAHKSKGREWHDVALWHDFPRVPTDAAELRSVPDPDAARAELNLLYVALTRARRVLNLAWLRSDLGTWLRDMDEPDEFTSDSTARVHAHAAARDG